MRAFFLGLIFLITVVDSCRAQAFLESCANRRMPDPYFNGVDQVISTAVQQPASLKLTTMPSFESESGVRLVGNEVVFVEFRSSFWKESYPPTGEGQMDFTKPRIKTDIHRAMIDARLARRIEKIYDRAINRAKKLNQGGLDGVSYRISNANGMCGLAWSPTPRSQNGRLITLLKLLEQHSKQFSERDVQRSERAIEKLLNLIDGL